MLPSGGKLAGHREMSKAGCCFLRSRLLDNLSKEPGAPHHLLAGLTLKECFGNGRCQAQGSSGLAGRILDVCFTPKSGHARRRHLCPFCAMNRRAVLWSDNNEVLLQVTP